jgi:hypothetical protein
MKCVELFCGTKSFSKAAEALGCETWTTDYDEQHSPDHVGDVLQESTQKIIFEQVKKADVVWMSPDCTKWSLSAGNTYWTAFRMPKRPETVEAMKMMMFCRFIADYCIKNNKIFFIENPNGRAVWIMDNQYMKRCWYCQYGDTRAKPTNIWTNLDITFKTCFNGNTDCHHEAAPRGSKTGTQGLKGSIERSRIPEQLFYHIFDVMNQGQKTLICKIMENTQNG